MSFPNPLEADLKEMKWLSVDAIFNVAGRVAVVTGGSKGIGRGLAEALARAGANVVVCSRNLTDASTTAEELRKYGVEAMAFSVDVKNKEQVQAMVDGTVAHFGQIDILINSAGVVVAKPVVDMTEDEWDYVIDTNLKGTFLCCQAVGRVMIEKGTGGRIINVSSILGAVGDVVVSSYCASKGGVVLLTKALAAEWARYGITVNAIGPSYIITDFNREALSDERVYNRIINKTPMRRLATIDDLIGTVLLLASDASSFITGQTIYIDGGWTAV